MASTRSTDARARKFAWYRHSGRPGSGKRCTWWARRRPASANPILNAHRMGLELAGRRLAHQVHRFPEPGLPECRYQANFLALASVLRVLAINLEVTDKYHGLTL